MNTQATSDWNIKIQSRRAVLLNYLLLASVVVGLVGIVSVYVSLPEGVSALTALAPFLVSWLIVLITWAWRSLGYRPRALIFLLLTYILSLIIFARGGLPGSGRSWLLLLLALTFILLGPRAGIAAGALGVLTYAFFAVAISQKWVVPQVADDLTTLAPLIGEGGSFLLVTIILMLIFWSFYRGWLEALAGASAANRQLQAQTRELEETNEQLHRQTRELQTTAGIAHACSSILDPKRLLTEVVNSIQEGLGPLDVYYVGLFLLDEPRRFAVLRAATGEAGQLLLDMDYKLQLDEASSVGWCITHRQARIARPGFPRSEEGEKDEVQSDALSMPHTHSEIALPLRSRGRILGALSVQSSQEAAFSEADITVLQTMADQVAVAIDNARLFSQTEAALKEVQAIQRQYLVQTWRDFLAVRPVAQIDYTQPGTEMGDKSFLREARRVAVEHGRTIAINSEDSPTLPEAEGSATPQAALVVPLKLRGQVIGTLALHETRRQRPWTAEEVALAENVTEQVALAIENLRLMDETQRRAARERLISGITDQMQRATDMEALLRITAEELNRALGGSRTFVRMGTKAEFTDGDGSGHKAQLER